jgi:hypothetical protein
VSTVTYLDCIKMKASVGTCLDCMIIKVPKAPGAYLEARFE